MTLLSIDPGTRYLGWMTWVQDEPDEWGTVRATGFYAMVGQVIGLLRHVDVVAIEGAYAGPNAHTTLVLAQFVGAVRGLCVDRGIPCHVAKTAQIDARCRIPTGIPREERKLITAALGRLQLGDGCTEHEYDAYCVGVWARGEGTIAAWAAAGSEE